MTSVKALRAVGYVLCAAGIAGVTFWSISAWGWWSWQTFAVAVFVDPLIVAIVAAAVAGIGVALGLEVDDGAESYR